MPRLKPYFKSIHALFLHSLRFSSLSTPSGAFLADKAITLLKRHPYQLQSFSSHFTPQAASYLLFKSQFDRTLTLKFLTWARTQHFFTSQCKCLALHVLTRFKLYKTAQTLAEELATSATDDTGSSIFHCLSDSYQEFNSSSAVFDLLLFAHQQGNNPEEIGKNLKVLDLDMNQWVSFLQRVEIQCSENVKIH